MFYSQSLFIAPDDNYDLEIIPQIRSQRGYGAYSYFRYADSPYSLLKLNAGFFTEKKDYQIDNDLDNKKHYGWSIDYERTKLFSSSNHQDGLYASINWLNDVEYETLENEDIILTLQKNQMMQHCKNCHKFIFIHIKKNY